MTSEAMTPEAWLPAADVYSNKTVILHHYQYTASSSAAMNQGK